MKRKVQGDILSSFNAAFRGLLSVLRSERNFRIHCVAALVVLIGCQFLNLALAEFLILVLTVSFVLTAEITNTLVEMIVDRIVPEQHTAARRMKDVSAALVLVASVSSVVVGYLIMAKYFPPDWRHLFDALGGSPWYLTFVALLAVTALAIVGKLSTRRRSLLSGGMPSLHSAVAFSAWTVVSFLTFQTEPLISFLVFLLAFWVAQSRVIRRIHTLSEVVIGGLLGFLLTTVVFQIFGR